MESSDRMYMCIRILIVLLILAYRAAPAEAQIKNSHPPLTVNSVVELQQGSSAFQQLIAMGFADHFPIGILVGPEQQQSICDARLKIFEKKTTIADLIKRINLDVPEYQAEINNGVLNIIPVPISLNLERFLETSIEEFHSPATSHYITGINFWMFVHAALQPTATTYYAGPVQNTKEAIGPFQMTEQTVRASLNMIASAGSGGVWILHGSKIKNLNETATIPYEIYGYAKASSSIVPTNTCHAN